MKTKVRIAIGIGAFLGFLLLLFLQTSFYSHREWEEGKRALQKNDQNQAITHFARAIHWYAPGSGIIKQSIQEIWKIGISAEKEGDNNLALEAFQSLRSSLYAARSFYTPYSSWIEACDDHFATLMAKQEAPLPNRGVNGGVAERKQRLLGVLKAPSAPSLFWSSIVEAGFWGWIGCTIVFIFRVFSGDQGFRPRRALLWGGLTVFFYAAWLLGMLNAR